MTTTTEVKKYQEQIFIGQKDLTTYEIIQSIVTEAFDAEFSRTVLSGNKDNIALIAEFFIKGDALSIYNPVVLKDIVETICTKNVLLKFIFSVTQRCTAAFALSNIEDKVIITAVVKSASIDRTVTDKNYCLLPRPIQESINITEIDVNNIIRNNFWTGIVYLLILFLEKTQTYKTLVENLG